MAVARSAGPSTFVLGSVRIWKDRTRCSYLLTGGPEAANAEPPMSNVGSPSPLLLAGLIEFEVFWIIAPTRRIRRLLRNNGSSPETEAWGPSHGSRDASQPKE